MADLADVLDALEQISRTAVFPSGSGQPSVTTRDIDVAQGWPLPADLDDALKVNETLVSVYAVPGTSSDPGQVFDWHPGATTTPPGITAVIAGNTVTLTGSPNVGDNIALTVDGVLFGYTAALGDTTAICLAMLAVPGAVQAGAALTVSGARRLSCQIGGTGTLNERIHRQRMQFMVVIWAPSPADRTTVAVAIDVALKSNLTLALPDGSEAIMTHQGTRLSDKFENIGEYRRDLIVIVTWDTFRADAAVEIVAPQVALNP